MSVCACILGYCRVLDLHVCDRWLYVCSSPLMFVVWNELLLSLGSLYRMISSTSFSTTSKKKQSDYKKDALLSRPTNRYVHPSTGPHSVCYTPKVASACRAEDCLAVWISSSTLCRSPQDVKKWRVVRGTSFFCLLYHGLRAVDGGGRSRSSCLSNRRAVYPWRERGW